MSGNSRSALLRFGSLLARVDDAEDPLAASVAHIFGTSLQPFSDQGKAKPQLSLSFRRLYSAKEAPPSKRQSSIESGSDKMVVTRERDGFRLDTEIFAVVVNQASAMTEVGVTLLDSETSTFDRDVHLAVLFHKMLFLLERVVLHAAAVSLNDRVVLILGDKGAGKSTSCLALGRAGATILGEDHIIVRRSLDDRGNPSFLASGCDERSRLTAKTEAHFFDEPLAVTPADYAGMLKKEVPAASLFRSLPYTERRPEAVLFSSVQDHFSLLPLPGQLALLRLMQSIGKMQRFVDAEDRRAFLGFLGDFVGSVNAYSLNLSSDLNEIDQLAKSLAGLPASTT